MLWHGRGWTTPVRVTGIQFDAVSCSGATQCLAVGYKAAAWDGRRWHAVANPKHAWELTDVDCSSPAYCTVGGVRGFYVRHDGLWSLPIRPSDGIEEAWVSCASAHACYGEVDIYEGTDIEDYTLDGAAVHPRDYRTGGYSSCVPGLCASIEGDTAVIGRR